MGHRIGALRIFNIFYRDNWPWFQQNVFELLTLEFLKAKLSARLKWQLITYQPIKMSIYFLQKMKYICKKSLFMMFGFKWTFVRATDFRIG